MMTKPPKLWRILGSLIAIALLYVASFTSVQAGTVPPGQSPGGSIAPGSSSDNNQDATPAPTLAAEPTTEPTVVATTNPTTSSSSSGSDISNNTGADSASPTTAGNNPEAESPEKLALASQDIQVVVEALPDDVTLPGAVVGDLVHSKVTSSFALKNSEKQDESTTVRLPLSDLSGLKDGKGQLMEAEDYAVMVAGVAVSPTVMEETNPLGGSEPPVKWIEFPITVPAGSTLVVSTTYSAPAAGALPLAQFNYALETAAGWSGKVAQSKVTLELPYDANKQNVFTGENESSPGGKISGNTVVWARRNFEPTSKDNIKMTILAPQVWTNIDNARSAVKQAPSDPEALLALARAYKGALLLENGVAQGSTAQFVDLANDAYKKAIKANPTSAPLRAEYAQFLMDTQVAGALNTRAAMPMLTSILDQAEAALKDDPKNQTALGLLANLKSLAADAAQRTPSTAATRLVGRIDTVANSVGTENVAAAATAVAATTVTNTTDVGAADASQGITNTAEVTSGVNGTATTGVVSQVTSTVAAAANAITGTAAAVTASASNRAGTPQMLLLIACGTLIVVGLIAAALILVFRRWNRTEKPDQSQSGQQ